MLNNKLTIDLIRSMKDINEELQQNPNFKIGKNNYHLQSDKGKYIANVFMYFNQLTSLIDNLNQVEVFLKRFPSKKYYESNGITELNYVQYHFEVFLHKIHTVLELKKLLLNAVYELGIPEKDCSWDKMKNIDLIKKSKAYPILNSYFSYFKSLIEARHFNTHRAVFIDSDKDNLSSDLFIYNSMKLLNLQLGDEFKGMIPQVILNRRIKIYRNERLKFVQQMRLKVEEYVRNFFNSIADDFFKRRDLKH